jgi:tetratricopeptide (TPR) repeat protein
VPYFQGMAWVNKGSSPSYLARARSFFERALALDAGNVEALVGRALVDAQTGCFFMTDDRVRLIEAAETALTRALSAAPNHAMAHCVLGLVQVFTNRADLGIAQCERALAFDPNLADAFAQIGFAKYATGRGEQTEAYVRQALRLSPYDTHVHIWLAWLGNAKAQLGLDEEAALWQRRAIEANRNLPNLHFFLASALALLGRLDAAHTAARDGLVLDPTFTIRRYRTGTATDDPIYLAGRERICEGMRRAGLPEGDIHPMSKPASV